MPNPDDRISPRVAGDRRGAARSPPDPRETLLRGRAGLVDAAETDLECLVAAPAKRASDGSWTRSKPSSPGPAIEGVVEAPDLRPVAFEGSDSLDAPSAVVE